MLFAGRALYTAPNGTDSGGCTQASDPCESLQYALGAAGDNDTVHMDGSRPYSVQHGHIEVAVTLVSWRQRAVIDCPRQKGCHFTLASAVTLSLRNVSLQFCRICVLDSDIVSDFTDFHSSVVELYGYTRVVGVFRNSRMVNTQLRLQQPPDWLNITSDVNAHVTLVLTNVSMHGEDTLLMVVERISCLNISFANVSLSSLEDTIYIGNFQTLHLRMTKSKFVGFRGRSCGFHVVGLAASRAHINISDCVFSDNHCQQGAVMSVRSQTKASVWLSVVRSQFARNTASVAGTALRVESAARGNGDIDVHVRACAFAMNTNTHSAGAIYAGRGRIDIVRTTFERNRVLSKSPLSTVTAAKKTGAGGAIVVDREATLRATGCTFSGNTASWFGGGIAATGAVRLTNTRLQNAVHDDHESPVGDLLFLMGKTSLENVTCVVTKAARNRALFWFSSRQPLRWAGHFSFTCPAGMQLRNESLLDVDENSPLSIRYKDLFIYCDACADGSYSLQRGYRRGSIGWFSGNWSDDFDCVDCPYGGACSGGVVHARLNFWGYQHTDLVTGRSAVALVACPDGYCCADEQCAAYDACAANRTGTFCGRCRSGTSEVLYSAECVSDTDCDNAWYLAADVLAAALTLVFFLCPTELAALTSRLLFPVSASASPANDPAAVAGVIKCVFYFYQTVGLLAVQPNQVEAELGLAIRPVVSQLLTFRPLVALLRLCPFPGVTPVVKALLAGTQTLYMFAMLGLLFIANSIYRRCSRHRAAYAMEMPPLDSRQYDHHDDCPPSPNSTFRCRLAAACLQLFLYNYVNISNVTFTLLACLSLAGKSVLYIDGSVQCYQPWQYVFVVIAVVHVLPLFLAVIVSRHLLQHRRIGPTQFLLSYFLPLPLLFYWLFCASYRRARPALSVRVRSAGESALLARSLLSVVEEPFVQRCGGGGGGQQRSYKHWEGVLILRRLTFSTLAAFVSRPLARLTLQTGACLAFLVSHTAARPYGAARVNALETASLCGLTAIAMTHLVQATFLAAGSLPHGPAALQVYVSDWLELAIVSILPATVVVCIAAFVLVRLIIVTISAIEALYRHGVDYCRRILGI